VKACPRARRQRRLRPESRVDRGFDLHQRPFGEGRRAAQVGTGGDIELGAVGVGRHLLLPAIGDALAMLGCAAESAGFELKGTMSIEKMRP
jgi:hypothetical protein